MDYGKFTKRSVMSCNVSYKKEIDAQTLIGILSGDIPIDNWKPHMDTFFNELPKSYIIGVMEENKLNKNQLVTVFESLPKVFQGKNFKEI